ncbi:MAG TPA: acetoacetate decarboxylase family protein [Acidimicrobiales bacterium]|nr:acetoacetate decarboxylase family protein [Acidimicrobiales bacterium]
MAMAPIRYAARRPEQVRNREVEATKAAIWSRALTVVFETDPELIASVLPRPLEPSEPTARLRIAVVDMGTGLEPFGAGWFGVRARHGDVEGEYALFMPMTTEQSTTGGRETYGEPKKIGEVGLALDGDHVHGRIARMGSTVAELTGTLGPEQPGYDKDKVDFYFKAFPDPSGNGLEADPAFVYCRRHEVARVVRPVTGECKLLDAPLDPVGEFPVREVVSFEYAEITTSQSGEIVERVPADWVLPFLHQRYDDLSVLGARS